MRGWSAVGVAGLLLASPRAAHAQAADSTGPAVAEAERAARPWLALVDEGRYGESWDSAAVVFRGAVTRSDWGGAVREGRAPFEPFGARELLGSAYQTQLPNAPPGAYVVIQFRTKAGKGRTVIETVTPAKEKDGRWRVAGYYVRPE